MTITTPTILIREVRAGRGRRTRFSVCVREDARTRERLHRTFYSFGEALRAATKQFGATVPVVQVDTSGGEGPWPYLTDSPTKNPEGGRLLRERLASGPVTPLPPDVWVAPRHPLFPCTREDYRNPISPKTEVACYCLPSRLLALDVIDYDTFEVYCRRCDRWFDWPSLRGLMETPRRLS